MFKMEGVKSGAVNTTITVTSATDFVNIDPNWQPSTENANRLSLHQIAIDPGDSTAGTITVTATPNGGASAETVYESDGTTPLVINLATSGEPESRKLSGYCLTDFVFTAAGMDGSDPWTVTISSGEV